jgi:hypothetical protein
VGANPTLIPDPSPMLGEGSFGALLSGFGMCPSPAREVHLGIKKVHFMVKKVASLRPCPLGAFYGQEASRMRVGFTLRRRAIPSSVDPDARVLDRVCPALHGQKRVP